MGSIVQDKYEKGCYYVDGQTWQVGTRYTLLNVLGSGSFSSVVSALDNNTGEKVALKRIPDVINNAENAKRVLREVCILRRLSHPHIISLKDVFLKPSSTGRYMYKGGKLVPTSLDLYLALEYCDQGDLFHMRGQLSEPEVKVIMLQLMSAVQYLHRNGVWHRDIKSANILMTYANGQRHIKLADLGSARSVLLEKRLKDSAPAEPGGCSHSSHSFQQHHHTPQCQQQQLQQPSRLGPLGSCQQGLAGQFGEGFVSQATQTSVSLGGAPGADTSPQRQRFSSLGGGLGPRGQGSGLGHSRRDSMDSLTSAEHANGHQPQGAAAGAGGGSGEQQQQTRRQGTGGRSVSFDGEAAAPAASSPQQQQKRGRLAPSGPPVHHSDSFLVDSHSSPSDIYARPVAGGGGGFKAPLTRMVCTPCYRAPEVVMSRGGYTESIDMWGCGCVFGELLQRVAWIGKATTPQLQVAPVFAIHGIPQTPTSGERFDGPGNSVTRTELAALFAVIGTPSWRCIESVANPAWRRYLRKITGRAPTLFRRFGSAGEVAVDLLARLLSFDPIRRCSSEEAIAHEYFEDLRKEAYSSTGNLAALLRHSSGDLQHLEGDDREQAVADALDAEIERQQHEDEEMEDWEAGRVDGSIQAGQQQQQQSLLSKQQQQQSSSVLKRPREHSLSASLPAAPSNSGLDPFTAAAIAAAAAAVAAAAPPVAAAGDDMDEDLRHGSIGGGAAAAAALPPLPPGKASGGGAGAGVGSSGGSLRQRQQQQQQQQQQQGELGEGLQELSSFRETPSGQHYYELDDPAAALAALEHDMAALMTGADAEDPDSAPGGPPPQAPQLLRELLEREVAEHISHLDKRRKEMAAVTPQPPLGVTPSPPGSPLLTPVLKRPSSAQANSIRNQWQHLQPDPGPTMDPSKIGFQRLPHHADAEQGHLDPQQHLRAGRHGEWMAETLQVASRTNAGNVWGVSLVPSGYSEESHPELAKIIKHQHGR